MNGNLKKYNAKRDFKKTKEPKGKKEKSYKKLRFVVQHHLARKDHYDLRLEWNGVLKSWAVPKGPSYNPKDKRLAILVEDHPLSYRLFEGTIPKGEYGGGTVMVFDMGYYEIINDVPKNFKTKEIKFILKGERLKGAWTLINIKDENWLLIKENDEFSNFLDITKIDKSVKTNRTMEEIANNVIKRKTTRKKGIVDNILITNPDKVIFPSSKIAKMDIAMYYHQVGKRMLPYLDKRLISTLRAPEGIKGDIFFKKHLEKLNKGLKKVMVNNNDYYYIKDMEGLIKEVQMNSFEFHIWGCPSNKINKPDIMVFDLDPDEKLPLKKVRDGVKDLKSILDELNLKAYLKTSGGKGYHVVVPLKNNLSWAKLEKISQNIASLMVMKWPFKYTTNIRKSKRKDKIFIDYLRNKKGATSVAPYSLRLREKAPVSMPIKWSELDKVKPNSIHIKEALQRLKKKDPWEDFFL